jgi:hypothetical protein
VREGCSLASDHATDFPLSFSDNVACSPSDSLHPFSASIWFIVSGFTFGKFSASFLRNWFSGPLFSVSSQLRKFFHQADINSQCHWCSLSACLVVNQRTCRRDSQPTTDLASNQPYYDSLNMLVLSRRKWSVLNVPVRPLHKNLGIWCKKSG